MFEGQLGIGQSLLFGGEGVGNIADLSPFVQRCVISASGVVILNCEAPCPIELEGLKVQPPDEPKLKGILIEFEFNSIGRRLFGEDFKTGRGYSSTAAPIPTEKPKAPAAAVEQLVLSAEVEEAPTAEPPST